MGLLKWLKRQPKKLENLDGLIGGALGGGMVGDLVGGMVSEALLKTVKGYTDEQAEQFIANMAFDGFWFKATDGRNALGIRMEPEAVTAAELLHDLEAFGRAVKRAVENTARHG
jgi:hypothetical protein